jgi:predicted PolB exonuclease-like 3'-5' exonuclease
LDAPQFRPKEIVRRFWLGVGMYERAKLVTFNGRCFDLPMLELAAFRHGLSLREYCQRSRSRFQGNQLDIFDWLTNFGACRLMGGLNLLAKMLGKPGKMEIAGDQVYGMHREGRLQEINDYCMFDTLDTYFVFLRTRVMTGDLGPEQEDEAIHKAREFLRSKTSELPALSRYLENWS